jgi:hypothetical protein
MHVTISCRDRQDTMIWTGNFSATSGTPTPMHFCVADAHEDFRLHVPIRVNPHFKATQ